MDIYTASEVAFRNGYEAGVKEFAEMLKERFSKEDYMLCDYEKDTIDNLAKELTESKNDFEG